MYLENLLRFFISLIYDKEKYKKNMTVASIDLGTNTILLLIAEVSLETGKIETLKNLYRIPRIGKGVNSGDPIPDENGEFKKTDKILLSQMGDKSSCVCVGVKDSSSEFLKYLDRNGIALGTKIQVLSKESFDGSMVLQIDRMEKTISKEVSNNLFVKSS